MTTYEGSPIRALAAALGEGLQPGQLGVVASRAGVGKSALLVHIALDHLLGDEAVLHVAVGDTVEHSRAHYDEVIRAAARGRNDDWAAAAVQAERHRMILSYLDKEFNLEELRANLVMLREVAHFRPRLVVFDGFDKDQLVACCDGIAELARELETPVWMSVNGEEPLPAEVAQCCTLRLRLSPEGRSVRLSLRRGPHDPSEAETLSLCLDPTSMLVQTGSGEAVQTPVMQASRCTLYSGGARGAESAFGEAAERHGVHEVNFTFDGHRQIRERGSYQLSNRELAAGDVSLVYVSKRLHRTYSTEGGLIRKVLQTLWHMVSRSRQVFVVGKIQADGTVVGGTGWSVELARMWNKELWVYDQERNGWYQWDGEGWSEGEPLINSVHFTGTGTRYLTDEGRAAITALFGRSFGA